MGARIRHYLEKDDNETESLRPPLRRPHTPVNCSQGGLNYISSGEEEMYEVLGHGLERNVFLQTLPDNDDLVDLFTTQLRDSLLREDFGSAHLFDQAHISLVDVTGRAFLRRASRLVELCQEDKDEPGHLKVDIDFRCKGGYIEGWLYIRHMGTNARQTGFKVRAEGALPLAIFKKLGGDQATAHQQERLDNLMQRPPEQHIGLEIRQALELTKSLLRNKDTLAEKDIYEAKTTGVFSKKAKGSEVDLSCYDGYELEDDITENTEEYFEVDRSWGHFDSAGCAGTGKDSSDSGKSRAKPRSARRRRFRVKNVIRFVQRISGWLALRPSKSDRKKYNQHDVCCF